MNAIEELSRTIDILIMISIITTERSFNTFKNNSNTGIYQGTDYAGITQFRGELAHGTQIILNYKQSVQKRSRKNA